MPCRRCGFDNREERRYCAECGAPLGGPCAACGFENEPGSRFCGGCGTALDGSGARRPAPSRAEPEPSAPVGERRHITVMFCDLVGSTALSARFDPEVVRDIIHALQRTCARAIQTYEGFVARYMGDGVLAYFGYPRAHEDDAERAARAGLDLVDAVRRLGARHGAPATGPLSVRVGIATGLVVVGDLIGEGAAEERTVVGDTPNLAARLQALAAPDCVVVSAETRALLGAGFECETAGRHALKGFPRPVEAWRVLGPTATATRFEARRLRGLTPLIGREAEIALALDRWRMTRAGDGQVILVSGEPGIGKSRLALAIQERVGGEAHHLQRYQCSPYHANSALHPVAEHLRLALGIRPGDSNGEKLDKLERSLSAIPGAVRLKAPLFAALLAIPFGDRYRPLELTPDRQKEETLTALADLTEALARERPLLAVFEDIHWIDPTTLELLDRIIERVQRMTAMIIVTFRPAFSTTWIGQPQVTLIALSRMSRRLSGAMVGEVAGGKELPEEVTRQILERTDGVPLFVEELTKTVLASGLLAEEENRYVLTGPLPPLAIPASLHDSLMARIDQLAAVKEVAQVGAAIGREFRQDLLAAVCSIDRKGLEAAVDRLIDSGLVFQRGGPPDPTYVFKHALVRDAAYESLLKSRRQVLHARILGILESRFPETVASEPEILAYHAGEAALAEKAVGYWEKAGRLAAERAANAEAIGHLGKGLQALSALPAGVDRARSEVSLRLSMAAIMRVIDRYDDAIRQLDQAEQVAAGHGLDSEHARIHHGRGNILFARGDQVGCLREHEESLALARKAASPRDEAVALGGMGDAYYLQGRMRTACVHFRRCVDLARQHGFEDIETSNLHMVGWSRLYLNELEEAEADGLATTEKAVGIRHYRAQLLGRSLTAFVRMEKGDFDWARGQADIALEISRRLGAGSFEAEALALLSRINLLKGRVAEACAQAEQALAISRRVGMRFFGPFILGTMALMADSRERRREIFAEAESILHRGCVGHNHFWFYRDAIDACLGAGEWQEAERFAQALENYARPEPLPWSDFFIARGRALAAVGCGRRDGEVSLALGHLLGAGRRAGLMPSLPAIEGALAGGS